MYLYLSHIGVDRRLKRRRLLGRVQTQYLHFSIRHVAGMFNTSSIQYLKQILLDIYSTLFMLIMQIFILKCSKI